MDGGDKPLAPPDGGGDKDAGLGKGSRPPKSPSAPREGVKGPRHGDRGHGNNRDHDDEDNPGKGKGGHGAEPGHDDDGKDDDEKGKGHAEDPLDDLR